MTSNITTAAREYATEKHASQRYGDQPYTVHLAAVREVLRWAGFEDGHTLATAAWLHDVVEDTDTSLDDVRARFGDDVADLVWAVTGVGKNRKERNLDTYRKIRACLRAATLKLADRIANVEASASAPDKLAMYRKEWPAFQEALDGLGMPSLWARLREALGVVGTRDVRLPATIDGPLPDVPDLAAQATRTVETAIKRDAERERQHIFGASDPGKTQA